MRDQSDEQEAEHLKLCSIYLFVWDQQIAI